MWKDTFFILKLFVYLQSYLKERASNYILKDL